MRYKTSALLGIVLLFVTGCAPDHPPLHPEMVVEAPAGTAESMEILGELFGITTTPDVIWYGKGLDQECFGGWGWIEPNGVGCIGGWYSGEEVLAVVSTGNPGTPVHRTPLSHEFYHYFLDMTTGSPDSDHRSPEWEELYSGRSGGLVDQGCDAIAAAGI